MFFGWLRARREAARQAEADADVLLLVKGDQIYAEARRRERVNLVRVSPFGSEPNPEHWRRVACIIAMRTGRQIGLDTATRMSQRP